MRWVFGIALLAAIGAAAFWLLAPGEAEPVGGALRVLRGGAEVEISGPLSLKLADALRKRGKVPVMQLDSVDGSRAGALAVAAAIKAAGSETVVTDRCFSVCVTAFMAGHRRWIGPFANVGLVPEAVAAYRQVGMPEALVAEAVATPPGQAWFPTQAEMLNAGLATDRAKPEQFALAGFGSAPTPTSIRDRLLSVPLYRAAAHADPNKFTATLNTWVTAIMTGEPGTIAFRDMQALLSDAFNAALLQAPDALLLAQADLFRDELAWMLLHERSICPQWAQAHGGTPGPTDDELIRRRRALELAVLNAVQLHSSVAPIPESYLEDCAHLERVWRDEANTADAIRLLLTR